MIDRCYGGMDEKIVTVDAYSALAAHTDEYLYFRTDHHWTQLGAYYAYTAFCEAAGFEPCAWTSSRPASMKTLSAPCTPIPRPIPRARP